MTPTATKSPVGSLFTSLQPRKVRIFREFAEQEIYLPSGPREGLPFRCDFMPWTALVLAEFDRSRYRRFFASGPVQGGKTLIFFVIPLLYHLFELGEDVIVGVPVVDLAQGIYDEKILPALRRTRYAELIPTSGIGSRGGKFTAIRFGNGAVLRFMGAGGGDAQRSSHTARVVIITELDKMDVAGKASRETDPVSQFEARASAFGSRARTYGECTMSIEEGRVYQEVVVYGTDTKVFIECPHCQGFVAPDRDHFVGCQGVGDVLAARESGCYACESCGAQWSEPDRAQALKNPVLAAKGQTAGVGGVVEGDGPRTNTFGFRWNAMQSAMVTMADIAEKEFRAEHSDNPLDMKALLQFTWAEPYRDELVNLSGITRDIILRKITQHPRGVVPESAEKLTVFIDLGLYLCWWTAVAWGKEAEGYVIDYGAIEVPHERKVNPLAILSSLRTFREDTLLPGWRRGAQQISPDLVLVDSGYQKDVAYKFVRESGQGVYFATKGMGSAKNESAWRKPKPGKGRKISDDWAIVRQPNGVQLVEMHSDHWKREVHQGFGAPPGSPGSLHLFHADRREHLGFARQITAEREEEEFVPGRGTMTYWNKVFKDNHYLDCAYGCRCAADMLGIRLMPGQKKKAVKQAPPKTGKKIRTKY